jgi:hypothetical protein
MYKSGVVKGVKKYEPSSFYLLADWILAFR